MTNGSRSNKSFFFSTNSVFLMGLQIHRNSTLYFWEFCKQTAVCKTTYTWGWDGSSPKETESPGTSLKHFAQKVYLSETKAGVGFLWKKSENNKKSRKKAYNFSKLTYFHRRNIWRPLEWYKSCSVGRNNTMFEDYRYVSFHNNSPKIASQDQFLLQTLQQAKKGGKIALVPYLRN